MMKTIIGNTRACIVIFEFVQRIGKKEGDNAALRQQMGLHLSLRSAMIIPMHKKE